jgi:phage/plasmid-like protein (TIGR03299 family)
MSAALTYTRSTTADLLSVRESPWHKGGHLLMVPPSFEEAMELPNLDYLVEKRQTNMPVYAADGTTVLSWRPSGAYVTVRTDTQKELGVVQERYRVVQNRDAFRILRPLVEEGVATIETAGVLRDGADAWMLVRFDWQKFGPKVQEIMGHKLRVSPYGLVANNHAGRRGILTALTPIRVVCANTLLASEREGCGDQIVVSHTESAEQRLVEAAQSLWGAIIDAYEKIAQAYDEMANTYLSLADFNRLVMPAVNPDPREHKDWNPEAKLAHVVLARYGARKHEITRLWHEGRGHKGDSSAWEAWQGAVEAIDHNPDLFPTRGGVYRTASLLDGKLRQMKQDVFENLHAFAVGKR